MGSKGSNTVTTQSQQQYTPAPAVGTAGTTALTGAEQAAAAPFQQPVAPVAGFSPFQQLAFGETLGTQGMAQPYFGLGSQYLMGSAAPVSGQDVANYYNPMAQNVFANLQDIFGQQMRETTGQATQLAGGVGADRIGVAQANLAKQQGLAAGQTASQLYQQALQAAEQQKQMMAGAGYGLGQMGPAAQAAQLQGIQALLGAGGMQQQLSQAQLNALYQNQLARIAYPFQTAQYLAGITGGLAPAMGGTTQGTATTTYPQPSPLAQILGLGTAGIGALGQMGGLSGLGGKGASLASAPSIGMKGAGIGSDLASAAPLLFLADGGAADSTYGKLADKAYLKELGDIVPAVEAGNPMADIMMHDIGGSLPMQAGGTPIANPMASATTTGVLGGAAPTQAASVASPFGGMPSSFQHWQPEPISWPHHRHWLPQQGGQNFSPMSPQVHAAFSGLTPQQYQPLGGMKGSNVGMQSGGEVIPFPKTGPNEYLIWDENVDKAVKNYIAKQNPQQQATRSALSKALGGTGNILPFHPFDPRSPSSGGDLTPVFQAGGDVEQPLPLPGASIPTGLTPIPMGGVTTPTGISPIPYAPVRSVQRPMQLDLHHQSLTPPTLKGQETISGDLAQAFKIASALKGMTLSARGGAVNPFDVGQPFQGGGDAGDTIDQQPFQTAMADISTDGMLDRAAAITRQQESGGDYGNVTTTKNRQGNPQSAIGAYGIMDFNVGPWTKEVLGKEMTPEQFRNDKGAQDAVYRAKMGEYINRFGPEGAGRAWLGGPGNVNNPMATDPLGTSVGSYGQRFAQGLGRSPNADMTAGQYMLPAADRPYPDALQRDWGQNLARSPWMALVAAGAQMAQTRGPIGSVIGAGLGAGAKELEGQRKELRSEQEINMKAQQLYQQAVEHLDAYKRVPAGEQANLVMKQQLLNKQLQQLGLEGLKPFKIGEDSNTGLDIYGVRNPQTGTVVPIDPLTGQPRTDVGVPVEPKPFDLKPEPQTSPPLGVEEFRPNLTPSKSTAPAMVKGPFATAEAGNIKNIDAQMNKSRDSLDIQRDQLTRLKMDYATVMRDADKDGFFQKLMTIPGADPETRVAVMRSANLAAMSAKKPPPFSPEKVAAMEEAIKIQKTMGMSFAATISPRDAMQMQLASISAQPGFTQSPQGMQRLIGLYDGLTNQGEARHDFWGRWKQTNPRTSAGWEEDFRNKNPSDKFTVRALVENIPNQRAKEALPQAIEHLRQNRNNPAEIAKFDRLFNNTSSYFLSGRLDPYAGL